MRTIPRTTIIAEAGVNHNGSVEMARQLVDAAVDAGADVVKFQTFRADKLTTSNAPKAAYQVKNTEKSSQQEMLKKLELSPQDHFMLRNYCESRHIEFLSTPFDMESARFLTRELGLARVKVGSGDLTNGPMLLQISRDNSPVILSTGMASLSEIEEALSILAFGYQVSTSIAPSTKAFREAYASEKAHRALREKVTLLHCTTEYPAPPDEANLLAIPSLKTTFGLEVGLSDHSLGFNVVVGAVALGAKMIEKHITLDKTLPGPDHAASLEPKEFTKMVAAIREIESALGHGFKIPAPSELKNKPIARKSLVAAKPIKKGEVFNEDNLTFKRPNTGLEPNKFWEMIGKPACRDFTVDEVIAP